LRIWVLYIIYILVSCVCTNNLLYSQLTKKEDKFIALAANGELNKVRNYLKKGIDINARNKAKWTALAYACKYNHNEVIKLLVDSGANVNQTVNVGSTPLQIALNNDNTEIAEYLISHNADIDIKDIMGMTALAWSAKQGDLKNVIFLIKHGADINSINVNSRTVLDIAINKNVKIYLKIKGAKTSKELLKINKE